MVAPEDNKASTAQPGTTNTAQPGTTSTAQPDNTNTTAQPENKNKDTTAQPEKTAQLDQLSSVIEKYGEMYVSHLGTGEAPPWLKLKKAYYCLLHKDAAKDPKFGKRLEDFMFKHSTENPGAQNWWGQTPPSCFLTMVDTKVEGETPLNQFSDGEASRWLKDSLCGLIAKDGVFKALEAGEKKKEAAEPSESMKGKSQGGWCMRSACCGGDKSPQEKTPKANDTGETSGKSTKNPNLDKQLQEYEDRLDRLLGVKEKTKGDRSNGWEPSVRTTKEYRRKMEEASRALAETLGDQDAWIDVGDGSISDLSLFMQTGLMAQWKDRNSQKKQPVVLAIRIWEQKKTSSGDQEKSKLATAKESQSKQQIEVSAAKKDLTDKENDLTAKTTALSEADTAEKAAQTTETDLKKKLDDALNVLKTQAEATTSAANPSTPVGGKVGQDKGEGEDTGEGDQDTKAEPPVVAAARKAHDDALKALTEATTKKNLAETAKADAAEERKRAETTWDNEKKKLDECNLKVQQAEAEEDIDKLEQQIQNKQDEQKQHPEGKISEDLAALQQKLFEAQKNLKAITKTADAQAPTTVRDLSDAIFTDPDDLSMKSPPLLACVTHVIYVHDIAQMADLRGRLLLGKRNINFLANGHKEKLYYKLLSEARFGSMFLVFDKTGGAAQEIAWDVYCHSSEKLEIIPPSFSTCGVRIYGSEFPTDQFKVVDPLLGLAKIKKMYGEILGAVQEYDADDDGAQMERKRIQYVWEQIAVFKHNGKAFRALGRMLQFSVVFLAFLTSATSIANTNCEAVRDKYLEIPRNDWQDKPCSFLTTICGLQESARGNVTYDSIRSASMVQLYGQLTILLPLIASIAFAVASKLNPTEKWAHLESAATALETEIYTYRSRSGRYSKQADPSTDDKSKANPKQVAADQPKGPNRRAMFADTVQRILEDALSSDMRNDYLIPPSTAENSVYVKLYDPEEERKRNRDRQTWICARWLKKIIACCKQPQKHILLPTKSSKAGFEVPLLTGENLKLATQEVDVCQEEGGLWYGSGADYEFNPAVLDGDLSSFKDDGIHELQPEQYLHARLAPMLRLYHKRARFLGRMVKMSQVLMTLLTGATTLFAAIKEVDLRPIVPVMVALNALVTQMCENERFQTRLVNVRKSIEALTEIQIWWSSLTSRDKQKAFAKAKLVTKTEEQADAEIAAWKKSAKVDDDAGEEEKKDDSKTK